MAYIAPQELIIEFPCSRIRAGVLHVLRTQLKSREGELKHVLRPFTLDNLVTYRQFLVQKHPGLILTMPVQTKGMRGRSAISEWKMTLCETVSFEAFASESLLQNSDSFGTGRRFQPDSYTLWVPPVEFTLTLSTDVYGGVNSWCTIRGWSFRFTEHGFGIPKRMKESSITTAQRFTAIVALRFQQHLIGLNQATPDVAELFPLAFVQRAVHHAV